MRKHYSATFKAEVVRELMKEEKTISQLAAEIGAGALRVPTQLKEWKKIALAGLPELFSRDGKASEQSKEHEQQVNELYGEIGRLTTQVTCAQRAPEKNLAEGATDIRLATPAWFLWLQTATHFSYALGRPTDYRLTLRKEKRRHDWYWYAYLKTDSKLHNAYVGRTHTLSAARLNQVAQGLLQKVRQREATADKKKKR